MARSHYVKIARKSKEDRRCRRCGTPILAGMSYYWTALKLQRGGIRKNFCSEHPPRPSDMTTSDKKASLYSAQEAVQDVMEHCDPKTKELLDPEDYKTTVAEALRSAAETANEVAEEYRESLSNMPEGLQEGDVGQQLEENASQCEEWATTLEEAADTIEGMEMEEEGESDPPEEGKEPDEDEKTRSREEAIEDFMNDIDSAADEAIGALEL